MSFEREDYSEQRELQLSSFILVEVGDFRDWETQSDFGSLERVVSVDHIAT